jgi:ORF6N domain
MVSATGSTSHATPVGVLGRPLVLHRLSIVVYAADLDGENRGAFDEPQPVRRPGADRVGGVGRVGFPPGRQFGDGIADAIGVGDAAPDIEGVRHGGTDSSSRNMAGIAWEHSVPHCRRIPGGYPDGMAKKDVATTIRPEQIEQAIQVLRGQRVLLDSDLARLYGVTTAALNQSVRRNPERLTLSHAAFPAVDSLSRSCSGVNLSTSPQLKPSGHGTPSRW